MDLDSSHLSRKDFVNEPLKTGSSLHLTFSDAIVNVVLDRTGDWTITVGITTRSDRLGTLTTLLGNLGFFQGTESDGILYFLWTSVLLQSQNSRLLTEQTLTRVLKSVDGGLAPSYIS